MADRIPYDDENGIIHHGKPTVADPIDAEMPMGNGNGDPVTPAWDHDGLTIDAIPVTAGTCGCSNNFGHTCEEVARLRAENAEIRGDNATLGSTVSELQAQNRALAAAIEDIAGITYSPAHEVYVTGECSRFQDPPCHEAEPTDPEDWCVTCVAEVAWSAWKMGVLG